jgi:hypothetical protein
VQRLELLTSLLGLDVLTRFAQFCLLLIALPLLTFCFLVVAQLGLEHDHPTFSRN